MEPLSLSTYDACDSESERQAQPFDTTTTTTLLLDGINAANRCDIHDNRNRKNMVPFLKSNYKYKRRVPQQMCAGRDHPQLNCSVMTASPKSVEVEVDAQRSRHLVSALSDDYEYLEVVAVGFIGSAVVIFRDILLNFLRRVARESRVWWCINSNKTDHRRVSEMSDNGKRFASDADSSGDRWRSRRCGAATSSSSFGWIKSLGLQYVSTSLKFIYLTLFIVLWMTVYEVEAGSCWMERMDNGKCESLYSKNITKAQCCGKNQMFSYTEKNLSNVEYFFALALGGGTECVPCLESCKDVTCGPNKRCVKRKGRPKCICSPQCGSGKKHKKSQKRKQQHQQQQHINQQNGSLKPPQVIDVTSRNKEHVSLVNFHSPITVRDVRSLSSEIHNNPSAVMVLKSPEDPISQSNSRRRNQRITPTTTTTTNPTKKQVNPSMAHKHRLHRHKQQKELDQQLQNQHHTATMARRRLDSAARNKGDKLIITADVRHNSDQDNDLAESNSLRDRTPNTASRHQHQHHGRHNFKKHAKPKPKISDPNGAANNSVHNGIATPTTPLNRNEMRIAERRRQRTQAQSFDPFTAPFAGGSKPQKFIPLIVHPSASSGETNNKDLLHPGRYYADDLTTFDDKIHNGFFSNGFPYPHQELSVIDEGRYTHPVCGSDGRTYNSECQLKKRACRTDNTALVVAYRGHCQTSCKKVNCLNGLQCVEDHYAIPHCIVCSIECPIDDDVNVGDSQRIDPARAVCGVDGNTYKSTCDINRMVCKIGRSIAVAYPGPCREDRTSCNNVGCGPKMTCLTDLVTHRPRCVSCKFKCSRKRRPTNLRYEEGKLCGTNNRTYYSWCEMKKDSCQTGFFIDIKSIGDCSQKG